MQTEAADFLEEQLVACFTPKAPCLPAQWQEENRMMEPGAAKRGFWRNFSFQVEP
jgi:hypothetical protein